VSSLTTRLALKRNDGTDPFLRADFTQNWNKLDQYPGTFVCTSGTRPSWGDAQIGLNIWETDTKLEYRWDGADWVLVNPVERMPGEVTMYAGGVVPSGWLLCDGSEKSRTTYAALFSAIGTQYGVGNGSTTFNLPDTKLRSIVGVGTGKALASNEGSAEGARNARWSHAHAHTASATVAGAGTGISVSINATATDHNHAMSFTHGQANNTTATGSAQRTTGTAHGSTDLAAQAQGQSHSHSNTVNDPGHAHGASATVNSGGSSDHPFLALNFLIKI
jgi:microcystin-dependent protein